MRLSRRALTAAAAIGATTAAVALVIPAAVAAVNLLNNPGFESGSLSGWSRVSGATAVTGQARSGTYALAGTPGSTTATFPQRPSVRGTAT